VGVGLNGANEIARHDIARIDNVASARNRETCFIVRLSYCSVLALLDLLTADDQCSNFITALQRTNHFLTT